MNEKICSQQFTYVLWFCPKIHSIFISYVWDGLIDEKNVVKHKRVENELSSKI
jgi:hypothetical protein